MPGSSGGTPYQNTYNAQLYYSIGAGDVAIPSTHRKFSFVSADIAIRGSFGIRHRFSAPIGPTSLLVIKLFVWESTHSGANLSLANISFFGTRYLK